MGAIATRPQGSVGNLLGPGEWDDRSVLVADGDDSNLIVATSVLIDDTDDVSGMNSLTFASTKKILFGQSSESISSQAAGRVDIDAASGVDINSSWLYVYGTVEASNYSAIAAAAPYYALNRGSVGGGGSISLARLQGDYTNEQILFAVDSYGGYQLVLTTQSNLTRDHDHASLSRPVFYVQSETSPDSNNTQWWSIQHNTTNAVYTVGTGLHYFANDVQVNGTLTATSLTDGTATLTTGAITGLTAVNSVTATELSQLETIGTTTISAGQWGYLGALNQALATTDSPTFNALAVTSVTDGTATMTGGALTGVGSVTISEDGWVGIGAAAERIVFDGTGDAINLLGANVGVGIAGSSDVQLNVSCALTVGIAGTSTKSTGNTNAIQGTAVTANSGSNRAFYADAANGATNYCFYGSSGNAFLTTTGQFQFRDSGLYIYSAADSYLDVVADGAFRVTAPTTYLSGSLGIGIAAPQELLDISALSAAKIRITSTNTTIGNDVLIGGIDFYGSDASAPGAGVKSAISVYSGTGGAETGDASYMTFSTSDGTTNNIERMRITAAGGVGIGTTTVPHGGVGAAKLAIEGTDTNLAGPHVQWTTSSDDYPLLHIMPWTHGSVYLLFDCYYDGTWKSSDSGSNFRIAKVNDIFRVDADESIAQGAAITWVTAFRVEADGEIMHAPGTALKTYWRDSAIYIASLADGYLDLEADTGIRLNAPTTLEIDQNAATVFRVQNDTNGASSIAMIALDSDSGIGYFQVRATSYSTHAGKMFIQADGNTTGLWIETAGTDDIDIAVATVSKVTYSSTITTHKQNQLLSTTSQFQFRDSGIYVYSQSDSNLSVVADGSITLDAPDVTAVRSLIVGVNDSVYGRLYLRGQATGSSDGGTVFFHTAADYDTSIDYFTICASSDDLEFRSVTTPKLTYKGGEDRWDFASDVLIAAGKDLDCMTNGAYFKPRRVRQAAQPTPDAGELLVWCDSDDDSVHLVYNDANGGVAQFDEV